jgi:hypothetical protein
MMSISRSGGRVKTAIVEAQANTPSLSEDFEENLATWEATEDREIHAIGIWDVETLDNSGTYQAEVSRHAKAKFVPEGETGEQDNTGVLWHQYGTTAGTTGGTSAPYGAFNTDSVIDMTDMPVPWDQHEELHLHVEDDSRGDFFQVMIWYTEK